MTAWRRLSELWRANDERLAERELRREVVEPEGSIPHTGGALYDEPFERTESVPGDDAPGE